MYKTLEICFIKAASVALHAVRVSQVKGGETALVIGAGMIGLLTMQAVRALGCARVFVADVDASRLRLAKEVGAEEVLHASGAELVAEILKRTEGRGVDLAFEAVGRNETVNGAIDCTRKGGTVTLIGNIQPEVTLPLQKVVTRQLRLAGFVRFGRRISAGHRADRERKNQGRAADYRRRSAEEGPRWFSRLHAREPNLMKVILTP